MLREKSLSVPSKYLLARDCDLLRCERFVSDRGVSITCSSSNVTVAPKSDRCETCRLAIGWTACPKWSFPIREGCGYKEPPRTGFVRWLLRLILRRLLSNPLSERFEFKIHREKKPRAKELDSSLASLESMFSTL